MVSVYAVLCSEYRSVIEIPVVFTLYAVCKYITEFPVGIEQLDIAQSRLCVLLIAARADRRHGTLLRILGDVGSVIN